jgi:DNA-binding response OmpR family regulator
LGQGVKTVAVCTASPALTAILSAVIAGKAGLRVRQFDSKAGLATYMRLAPVSLLVCDLDDAAMVAEIRQDERVVERDLEVIALTRTLTRHERARAVNAGIDEVILKPMSPAYLMERVVARLGRLAEKSEAMGFAGIERRTQQRAPIAAYRRVTDNVVQLFPHSWQPNP